MSMSSTLQIESLAPGTSRRVILVSDRLSGRCHYCDLVRGAHSGRESEYHPAGSSTWSIRRLSFPVHTPGYSEILFFVFLGSN